MSQGMKGLTHWLTVAKSSLTILIKILQVKAYLGKILKRNVNQNTINNSPSNILWNYAQFQSYCQKFPRSRRQFLDEAWMGLAEHDQQLSFIKYLVKSLFIYMLLSKVWKIQTTLVVGISRPEKGESCVQPKGGRVDRARTGLQWWYLESHGFQIRLPRSYER